MSDRIELDSSEFRQLVVIIMQDAVERNTLANLRKYVLDQENKNKFRKERFFSMDAMEYLEVVKDIMSANSKMNVLAATLGINCGVVREGEFKFSFVIDSIRIDYDLDPITRKGSVVMRDRLDEIKEIETKAQDYIKSLVDSR